MNNFSNLSGVNNLTHLNDEQISLNNSLRVSNDMEKQGNLVFDELESQKSYLSVFLFFYLVECSE